MAPRAERRMPLAMAAEVAVEAYRDRPSSRWRAVVDGHTRRYLLSQNPQGDQSQRLQAAAAALPLDYGVPATIGGSSSSEVITGTGADAAPASRMSATPW